MNYLIVLFSIVIVVLSVFIISIETFKNYKKDKNPCTDYLSDKEYLEHMIPHHIVAIDMSKELIKTSKNAIMLGLARNIIRHQSYEVWEMKRMMANLEPNNLFANENRFKSDKLQIYSKFNFYEPKKSRYIGDSCDPLFFDPDAHMKHMEHMEINDKSYLEHMIPHHQVAIDMSKRLLLHTNNSYLIDFCRKLIIDQQGEIFTMKNLLKNTYNYKSELVKD